MKASEWLAAGIASSGTPYWFTSPGPLIVMYHGVGGIDGITVESLERQLRALKARRLVVRLTEAVQMLGRPGVEDLAAITFDDGYRDFMELAVPVLSALQLPATLFVPGAWLGKTNGWDAGHVTERAIMTARELRELDHTLVTVGAHGMTHRRLSRVDHSILHAETALARRIIEDACGRPVNLFAYPYGQSDDFDASAERAVETAGFVAACSTCFGRGSRPADRFRLRRVGIDPRDSLTVVEQKFDGAYDWVAWKERAGALVRNWRHVVRRA